MNFLLVLTLSVRVARAVPSVLVPSTLVVPMTREVEISFSALFRVPSEFRVPFTYRLTALPTMSGVTGSFSFTRVVASLGSTLVRVALPSAVMPVTVAVTFTMP